MSVQVDCLILLNDCTLFVIFFSWFITDESNGLDCSQYFTIIANSVLSHFGHMQVYL